MKWIIRIMLVLVVLAVAVMFAAQYVLKNKLTGIMNKRVMPVIEKKMGVQAAIADARVGLFQGTVNLNGFTLGNPAGFDEPYLLQLGSIALKVNPLKLIAGGGMDIQHFVVSDAELIIVRSKEKQVNIEVVEQYAAKGKKKKASEKDRADKAAKQKKAPAAPEKTKPSSPLKLKLDDGDLDLRVSYIDYSDRAADNGEPLRLVLHQVITVKNLHLGIDAPAWADIAIKGGLEGKEHLCATSISGKISPIMDPAAFSFDLSGTVANIDPEIYTPYLEEQEITCEGMNIELRLKCDDGIFDSMVSTISLVMTQVKLPEKIAKSIPGRVDTFERLSVPIGIRGTLESPKTDGMLVALTRTLVENLANNKELRDALVNEVGKLFGGDKDKTQDGETGEAAGKEATSEQKDDKDEQVKELIGGALNKLFDK